jgi:hypothetical protein
MAAAGGAAGRGLKAEARKARRLELLVTLRRAREELGRWPTPSEWEASTSWHVSRRTYERHFGSWRRACERAGRLKL